ncbi:hypothetical protein GCM10022421_03300 [Oceanisphaera sediminis]|uniref:Uncharacterized protein n=1 Tax=Oceanisphaera sediminis TaxID=981381 RepID=A0ABP7D733_9GAMM
MGSGDWGFERRYAEPESRIPNPESRIPNPESRIPNPESRKAKNQLEAGFLLFKMTGVPRAETGH